MFFIIIQTIEFVYNLHNVVRKERTTLIICNDERSLFNDGGSNRKLGGGNQALALVWDGHLLEHYYEILVLGSERIPFKLSN